MKTKDFEFELPPDLIAQQPADRRDQSRLLVVRRQERCWEHRVFADLPDFLNAGDLLVVNDTRVIPARIYGRKPSGGRVEVLLLEEIEPDVWEVLLHAAHRPKVGAAFTLGDGGAQAVLLEDGEKGRARIRVEAPRPFLEWIEQQGEPPLPPYIKRTEGTAGQGADRERYQTVYASVPGAVAAPTAGLHFTPDVLRQLSDKGVDLARVTLHVGVGTFRPVKVEEVEDHRMESERYVVPSETAEKIAAARARGGRIVAVGTTTTRTLESVAAEDGAVRAGSGRTEIFIRPPYRFKTVDVLLTNFHLPKSTLLMLVSAFAGREFILAAYAEAVRQGYRFYSYGDGMLIL